MPLLWKAIELFNHGMSDKIVVNDEPVLPDVLYDPVRKKYAIIAGEKLLAFGDVPENPGDEFIERVADQISESLRKMRKVVVIYSEK